jgi:hypothetical protein
MGRRAWLLLMLGFFPLGASARDEDLFRREVRTILFTTADVGRAPFVSAGYKRAYDGSLDESGFLFTTSSGLGGRWRRPEGAPLAPRFFQAEAQASQLFGFQIVTNRVYAALHAGLRSDRRIESDGAVGLQRTTWLAQGDLWWRPAPETLMILSASTDGDGPGFRLRMAGGWHLRGVYIGPEFIVAGNGEWRDARAGLHASGLRLGPISLNLSAGVARTESRPLDLYTTLSLDWRL